VAVIASVGKEEKLVFTSFYFEIISSTLACSLPAPEQQIYFSLDQKSQMVELLICSIKNLT